MIQQTIRYFFILLIALGIYLLGYWQGQGRPGWSTIVSFSGAEQPGAAPLSASPIDQKNPEGRLEVDLESDRIDSLDQLLDKLDWTGLLDQIASDPNRVTTEFGARLLSQMQQAFNKYDAPVMRAVLRAYLEVYPGDIAALFLLSDLQQTSGLREQALETLFDVLGGIITTAQGQRARREVDLIISVIDNELRARGALAEREAFWRQITQRYTASDRYRYQWSVSLAALQQWDMARRVLMETGTSDIAQVMLDNLAGRIDNAQFGLRFTRDEDRLLAMASAHNGASLTLLVDTGANMTSLTRQALLAAGAQPLEGVVRMRTAGGVVETGVFQVAQLKIQGQLFTDVRVLELPVTLPGLDGLLGLDIINQLSANPMGLD